MGTALQTTNPRVSDVLASILREAARGARRARSRHSHGLAEKCIYRVSVKRRPTHWRGSAYGAACKCYDLPLCSLVIVVLAEHLTRSTMAPMGSTGGSFLATCLLTGKKETKKKKRKETSTSRMQDTRV